jgi:CHAT domain-containing protein
VACWPLECHNPLSASEQYERSLSSFRHGKLAESETSAFNSARALSFSDPLWSARLQVVRAEAAVWRGEYQIALDALKSTTSISDNPEFITRRLAITGLAQTHLHNYQQAENSLSQALSICVRTQNSACGELIRARGSLELERGKYNNADAFFLESLRFARRNGQQWDESISLMNLGVSRLEEERFDEAISSFREANEIAAALASGDVLVNIAGNLGWAIYKLGDRDKALGMFAKAEQEAILLGDVDDAITWKTTAGFVYQDSGDLGRAEEAYRGALTLSRQIDSREGVINSLVSLAHASADSEQFEQAENYLSQVAPLIHMNKNDVDEAYVVWARAKIAAGKREDMLAESLYRALDADPVSLTSMRFEAQHELAQLFELQGRTDLALNMYRTALGTFEGARDQLRNEDSRLPFQGNATRIYDDYIHALIASGRTDESLIVADQSRARTLAQGLGTSAHERVNASVAFSPQAVARKTGATLLFYWLGEKRSYLWAVTPKQTALFPLPAQDQITVLVERYNRELLGAGDPLNVNEGAGPKLYAMLVAPAAQMLESQAVVKAPVMVLTDGPLSLLNFETLIVPAGKASEKPHYWIEDATLISAPSLAMLASAKPSSQAAQTQGRLLLLGDAVSPETDYPELPYASIEMKEIEKHFTAGSTAVFARRQATAAAYLRSDPEQYSYIHFVSHGVASRTDPLDSAIILSRPGSGVGSSAISGAGQAGFKLYAREIMQHHIDARVVTISACYSSGTRAFAGEGLVGLSWAFLRAGAHSTIGALWEVNDSSTSRLMGTFYEGLGNGLTPASALRAAKLNLVHSKGNVRKPFYWGPFQLYTRN